MVAQWQNLRYLFPNLLKRSRFNRRRRNLMAAINALRQAFLDLLDDTQFVIDSFSITIIEFKKAYFSKARSYWRSYGASFDKIATKAQTIFGYNLHLLVTLNGLILDFELTVANQADLVASLELFDQQQAKRC